MRLEGRRTGIAIALGLVLFAGLVARLFGIGFGLPAMLDPDELIFELAAIHMLESGTGNPGWFGHPATTTIYVLAIITVSVFLLGWLQGAYAAPDDFAQAVFLNPELVILPGRIAMVGFAMLGLYLLYRLGRRVAGPWCGVTAAAIMAVSPLHVSWSQVVRSDIVATTFLVATMLVAWRYYYSGRRRDLVLACLCVALAIASKWPFAVAILSVWAAALLRGLQHDRWGNAIGSCLLILLLSAGMNILLSPFLLLELPTVLSNLQGERQVQHLGSTGGGFLANFAYYLGVLLRTGVGLAGGALVLAGTVFLRRNVPFLLIVGLPALVLLVIFSAHTLVWERWAIALLPACALAIGVAVARLQKLIQPFDSGLRAALAAVATLTLFAPLVWQVNINASERLHDNRRLATDWAAAHLPPNATIMVEHFAFDLLSSKLNPIFPVGTAGCLNARKTLISGFDYSEIDGIRGGNSNLDYAAVPQAKLTSCKADFAVLTEFARYHAERAAFPKQDAQYSALLSSGRVVARFPAIRGKVGGRPEVVVVDLRQR